MSILTQIFSSAPPQRHGGDINNLLLQAGGVIPNTQGQEAAAMVNTTVNRAMGLIATTSAALPARVVRRGDKSRQEIRDSSQRHIWGKPNKATRRVNFWESLYTSCLLPGNAYAWKGRRAGRINRREPWRSVEELWFVRPDRVKVGVASDGSKVFELDGEHAFTDQEIMHIPALSTNGVTGNSPLDTITLPINIVDAAGRFGQRFFTAGQALSGVLKTDQELSQEQADDIRDRWLERKAGLLNSFDVAVLGKGAEYKPIAIDPEKAQALQMIEHWELRIAMAYGIPPHMLGIVDRSTSWGTGIEQQTIGFVQYTLVPWLIRFEQAIEDELLPDEQQVKFALDGLLRGDTLQRFTAYRIAMASKFMVPNEAREFEDLPPLPGGDSVIEDSTRSGMEGGGGMPEPQGPREEALTTGNIDDIIEGIERKLRADAYEERVLAEIDGLLEEGRCPRCEKLLARRVNRGAELECRRCRQVVAVEA